MFIIFYITNAHDSFSLGWVENNYIRLVNLIQSDTKLSLNCPI